VLESEGPAAAADIMERRRRDYSILISSITESRWPLIKEGERLTREEERGEREGRRGGGVRHCGEEDFAGDDCGGRDGEKDLSSMGIRDDTFTLWVSRSAPSRCSDSVTALSSWEESPPFPTSFFTSSLPIRWDEPGDRWKAGWG
jgi:hypothetical protein